MNTFNVQYESDAGHGWIIVAADDVSRVGLSAKDFTCFSYYSDIDGRRMFALEEDCDAHKFHSYCQELGYEWNLRETYSDSSDVRNWCSIERAQPSIIDQLIAEQEVMTDRDFYAMHGAY